jgi:hypothetical protein
MITLVFCLRRLSTLSASEFQDRWLNGHGPLVAERAEALRICRYVQSHTFEHSSLGAAAAIRNAPEPFDGITQVSWRSMDDLLATLDDRAAARAARELLEDERGFIDLPRSPIFFTREHVVVG